MRKCKSLRLLWSWYALLIFYSIPTRSEGGASAERLRSGGEQGKDIFRPEAVIMDNKHPLQGRRVFWAGFPFVQDFIVNFLQVNEANVYKYKRNLHNSTNLDILVMSGACKQCTSFPGLILYIDGEAGKLQLEVSKNTNLIYLGVTNVALPAHTTHIKLMYGISALRYSTLFVDMTFNRAVDTAQKTKFVAYAASKCLRHREKVFDALVDLAHSHNLGDITAFGKCHGSSKNLHKHNILPEIASGRVNYVSNRVMFRPYRYVLCMENDDIAHYITEKIFNVYQAGAIPIYWGASNIIKDLFHPDTFILVDAHQPSAAISRVLEIENSPKLYQRIINTPVLLRGAFTLKKYFALNISKEEAMISPLHKYKSLSNFIWACILERLKPFPT